MSQRGSAATSPSPTPAKRSVLRSPSPVSPPLWSAGSRSVSPEPALLPRRSTVSKAYNLANSHEPLRPRHYSTSTGHTDSIEPLGGISRRRPFFSRVFSRRHKSIAGGGQSALGSGAAAAAANQVPARKILDEHSPAPWLPLNRGSTIQVLNSPRPHLRTLQRMSKPLLACLFGGFLGHVALAAVMTSLFGLALPHSFVDRAGQPLDWLSLTNFCTTVLLTLSAPAGYGPCSVCPVAVWLYYLAVYLSLMLKLVMLGSFFVFFAHAPAHISLSRWIVITRNSLSGLQSLEFRLFNDHGAEEPMLHIEATVVLSWLASSGHSDQRRFYTLDLLESKQPHVFTHWTVSHVITQESPLHGVDMSALMSRRANISVLIAAVNPRTLTRVFVTQTYGLQDILYDADFLPLEKYDQATNTVTVDYAKLSCVHVQRPMASSSFQSGTIL